MMQRACVLLMLTVTHAAAQCVHARMQTLQVGLCCTPAPCRAPYIMSCSARRLCLPATPCLPGPSCLYFC